MIENKKLTTSSGESVGGNQNSLTAGPRETLLHQNYFLIEKLAHYLKG
ncbi:MAG: catalase [Chloroflexi bacterium AL-W]|nr:catalase [Chloroflexi bacterium AL-N1]NOK71624.1 catalase [Chloroflexi bacterium AL-N10]NOK78924.1 catalase [Chloroflexi bacterium AL-N5]NOK86399.1 catalase [Chloroflexi bacterium AL-W]